MDASLPIADLQKEDVSDQRLATGASEKRLFGGIPVSLSLLCLSVVCLSLSMCASLHYLRACVPHSCVYCILAGAEFPSCHFLYLDGEDEGSGLRAIVLGRNGRNQSKERKDEHRRGKQGVSVSELTGCSLILLFLLLPRASAATMRTPQPQGVGSLSQREATQAGGENPLHAIFLSILAACVDRGPV